jgi:uncharacterized protein (TIGR03790 family)
MSRPSLLLTLLLLLAAGLALPAATPKQSDDDDAPLAASLPRLRAADELAAQTIVICNETDRDSLALAGHYVEKRKIPLKNLIALACPKTEEISRADFDAKIAEPLRKILAERGFWKLLPEPNEYGRVQETSVRFAVLMQGIPLRVGAAGEYEGDSTEGIPREIFTRSECAVDSELALLGVYTRRVSGVLYNRYFRGDRVIGDTDINSQLLVCRLDGPTPAIVRRMIDDSIATEAKGLRGFTYVDAQGIADGGLKQGDNWLHNLAVDARKAGQAVILDNGPAIFPAGYPMKHVALYYGWYSENVGGPFAQPDFKFEPGAVAVHLHSFSAVTIRDKSSHWCGPLLAAGAAATLGNVAEPYLALTPHLDIFAQRLREGYTFAEAAYMSQRFLSWMTTFIGDPLYRPFANRQLDETNEWDAYRAGVKVWLETNRAAGETALKASAKRLKSGVVSEALGLLELSGGDNTAAVAAFQQARATYSEVDDRLRVAIHESSALTKLHSPLDAAKFLRAQAAANPGVPSALLLDVLANNLDPKANKLPPSKVKPPAPKDVTPPKEPVRPKPKAP